MSFHEDGSVKIQSWNKTEPGFSKIVLSKDGNISIHGTKEIDFIAPTISMIATKQIKLLSRQITNVAITKATTVSNAIELNSCFGAVNVKSFLNPAGHTIL